MVLAVWREQDAELRTDRKLGVRKQEQGVKVDRGRKSREGEM